MPIEALVVDPVVAVTGDALEGRAADESEGLGAQRTRLRRHSSSGRPLGSGGRRSPSPTHALDEVATGDCRVGQVLGPDPAAQCGEVVVHGLARYLAPGASERPHAESDLIRAQVMSVVEDQVGDERLEDGDPPSSEKPASSTPTKDVDARWAWVRREQCRRRPESDSGASDSATVAVLASGAGASGTTVSAGSGTRRSDQPAWVVGGLAWTTSSKRRQGPGRGPPARSRGRRHWPGDRRPRSPGRPSGAGAGRPTVAFSGRRRRERPGSPQSETSAHRRRGWCCLLRPCRA